MMNEKFVTLTDEELGNVTGGQTLSSQLLQIYNAIWPNNTAPIPYNTSRVQAPSTQYNPYNYWY